jgi:hypothetical protein
MTQIIFRFSVLWLLRDRTLKHLYPKVGQFTGGLKINFWLYNLTKKFIGIMPDRIHYLKLFQIHCFQGAGLLFAYD